MSTGTGLPPPVLFAAGSLRAALGEIAGRFETERGVAVETVFAPSGLLRRRIEAGEAAHVFASADMGHPQALHEAGLAGPARCFSRNTLCALVRPGLDLAADGLLDRLLDPAIRIGISTPLADPSGDYALEMFRKAERLAPGAGAVLDAKARRLTGGPGMAPPAGGRSPYAAVMAADEADVFLTYRTNARLAQAEMPALRIVDVPPALSVGADYGLTVLNAAPAAARDLADFVLSAPARAMLASHGFLPPPG